MFNKSYKVKFSKKPTAALLLENGDIYWGHGLGSKKKAIGELCFNTSQTGYQEVLTDPSYSNQIITFTFPHIGIVGTNKEDYESSKVFASGCIISQPSEFNSNWRSEKNLDFFFKQNKIPCIYGIDTRKLTRDLAKKGAVKSAIINFGKKDINIKNIIKEIKLWNGLKKLDLAKIVSTKKIYGWKKSIWQSSFTKKIDKRKNKYKIVCLDFGIKENILRNLKNNNFIIKVLPAESSFEKIVSNKPQGIFLSNGHGDPFATGRYAVPTLKKIMKKKIPIFGICLGHQILSLALGAKTKKMFQGHRGANHPVKNIKSNTVEITSQNHGFEVDRKTLPENIIETHISLFDKTNEGIKHKRLPFFSVQYHPEASPGPHDSNYLFKQFYKLVKKYAEKK